ncbi:conjugal transfer protein TraI [Chitinophaga sp. MM2321]|uniref:conjugal transfer protein TraI n=1 Tax=Chitinophaga sp. MM2321 TaxID=3137178 RepID=UPI0032D59C63
MLSLLLCFTLVIAPTQKSHAIWWIVIKAAVKKAILAADLAIQRQQNKVIWLQNAQKTLENAMAKLKLDEISDWTEKQRNLYRGYFEELNKVKTIITYYKRIKEIGQQQIRIVEEYNRAWRLVRQDKNFTLDEINHIGNVYHGILEETLKNVEQLSLVVNSFATSMSDAKRLEIIGDAAEKVDQNYSDLKRFTNENYILSLTRSKSKVELEQLKVMYGIKE